MSTAWPGILIKITGHLHIILAIDAYAIEPELDLVEVIEGAVGLGDVSLALIGPHRSAGSRSAGSAVL